jgi:hypothetical protein
MMTTRYCEIVSEIVLAINLAGKEPISTDFM